VGFFPDAEVPVAAVMGAKRGRGGGTTKADRDFSDALRGCEGCSLRANWAWISSAKMGISGNVKDPDILVLGEAPGEEEDAEGRAFVGDTGIMLRRLIPGIALERVAFQNTVRCRPRGNATPSARDAHACSLYLEEDVDAHNFKAILGVGSIPLARFLPGQAITRVHGTRFPVRLGSKVLWYYPVLHPAFVIRQGGKSSPAYPVLQADVKRFFAEVDRWPAPQILEAKPSEVICPTSLEEAQELTDAMQDPIAVDLESSHLRPYFKGSLLLTAAVSDGDLTIAFPIAHPEAPTDWGLPFLLDLVQRRRWIAQNAIMELTWMLYKAAQADIDFTPADFDDSMAYARVYHQRETILGLELLSRIHLGCSIKSVIPVNIKNMTEEPLERILPYNGLDAWATARIARMLAGKVDTAAYQRILRTIRSTAQMELDGLPTSEEASLRLQTFWRGEKERILAATSGIYEVRRFEAEKQIEFNIGSNDHVGEALVTYGRINLPRLQRAYQTDDKALKEHAEGNPLAENTVRYREAVRMESTYILPVIRAREEYADGRLHPTYSTMLTATGRLSSEDPNIQNFPKRRHRELREQVVARPGHVLVSFDYGQLEARMFAMASRCKGLCPSVIEGIDIHYKWLHRALEAYPPYMDRLAEKTNETEESRILKGGRDTIKTDFVFASFFGSVAEACSSRTGIPLHITRELLGEFWQEYPGVKKWVQARRQEYQDTGSVRLLTGLVRHGILNGNEPLNTPIQGSAAHIVLEAQNDLYAFSVEMDDPYLRPRINIHDDLTFELPDQEDLLSVYIEEIAKRLTAIRFDFQIVPLAVDAQLGYNWADMEKVQTFVGPYIR